MRAIILSADPETRRLKLSMKQLEATPADQLLKEFAVGDQVTGRIVQVRGNEVRVQLGEGIEGVCRFQDQGASGASATPSSGSLAEQLAAAWKGGAKSTPAASESYREGELRSFKVKSIDGKRIELGPA